MKTLKILATAVVLFVAMIVLIIVAINNQTPTDLPLTPEQIQEHNEEIVRIHEDMRKNGYLP